MRIALISVIVLAIVLGFGVKAAFPDYEDVAEKRVKTVLTGMQDGTQPTTKTETAMNIWAFNMIRVSDRDRLAWASDHFDKWRQEGDIYRKTGEFTIDKVELVPGAPEETALVTFTLEGKVYKVRVPKEHAISWVWD
jgi:hypothetical protein